MCKKLSLLFSLVMVLFLVGCVGNQTATPPSNEPAAVLLSMYVPQDEQAISGTVTLTKADLEVEVPLIISGNTATAVANNMEAGSWHLLARLRDNNNYIIYEGERDAVVQANGTITVNLHLNMTPGDVTTRINLSGITGVASGKVEFRNGDTLVSEQNITINGTQGTAAFNALKARIWDIKVSLYDASGKTIRAARNSVQVMPGRMNYVDIDFTSGTGDLQINVTWDLPPAFPTNVAAVLTNGTIKVTWTANSEAKVVGYRVYRSVAQAGPFIRVSGTLVSGTEFTDTDVYQGNTYWYQVVAVTNTGDDSGFADNAVSVQYPVPQTETPQVLKSYDATSGNLPSFYGWTYSTTGGTAVMNGNEVVITTNEVTSYYVYTHSYTTSDKIYMKSRAKRLSVTNDDVYANIVGWASNGVYGNMVELRANGVFVRGCNRTFTNIDTSIYHDYMVTLKNDLSEVFVDGQLLWSGQTVVTRGDKSFYIGDASSSYSTHMAFTSMEVGKLIIN